MKSFGKLVGGSLVTLAFIFGISVASSATAEAQYRNDGQYRRRDRDRDRDNDGDQHRDWRRNRNRDRDRDRDRDWNRQRNTRVYGNSGGYGGYGGYNNGSQYEVNRGYQEGLNTGSSDARRGQSYSPQRSHWWRDAPTQAFRQGFVQGYDQGFRQYAGYQNDRYGRRNTGGILGGIFGRP